MSRFTYGHTVVTIDIFESLRLIIIDVSFQSFEI